MTNILKAKRKKYLGRKISKSDWEKKKKQKHQNSNIGFLAVFEFFLKDIGVILVSSQSW